MSAGYSKGRTAVVWCYRINYGYDFPFYVALYAGRYVASCWNTS